MKISYNWLKTFLDLDLEPRTLVDQLTMLGLEVEDVELYESIRGSFKDLVIGTVLTCVQHPNAERLKLTTVDVGGKVLQIVCGAPNVAAGQKVVVAKVGVTLYTYDNKTIKLKKSKIRGQVSEGMICAEDEIGISEEHEGILVLTTDLPNGTPVAEHLKPYQDQVITIDLTPNRCDATSHLGVAKDLKALLKQTLKYPDLSSFRVDNHSLPMEVSILNTEACWRYSGLSLKNVELRPSPTWLQNRLKAIGLNPINNIVDITNYVMFTFGQPLHAFDYEKITDQRIRVETKPEGTPFLALDGETIQLKEQDLMICDAESKPMCIGGVFGGLDSGITARTRHVFLEAACFSPEYVRRSSLVHQLKTDAAYRFERGTDPNGTVNALKYAAILIRELTGAEIASDIVDVYPNPIPNREIQLSFSNIKRLMGINLERAALEDLLKDLDFDIIAENETHITVSVPSAKVDVTREVDVIEELLRIYGYDKIPLSSNLNSTYLADTNLHDEFTLETKISHVLVGKGFNQIFTNPIVKKNTDEDLIKIENALSEDLNALRNNLVLSGLEVIAYNINRKHFNLALFEFGKIYRTDSRTFEERSVLGLWLTQKLQQEHWLKSDDLKFQDLSGLVQNILELLNIKRYETQSLEHKYITGLRYLKNKVILAEVGLVKAEFIEQFNLKQDVLYAQIEWETCLKQLDSKTVYRPIPKYPPVRRDLSLIIDKDTTYQSIEAKIRQTERRLIQDIKVFDVYENAATLGQDKKSYSISILLQSQTKTLDDKTIERTMKKIMQAVSSLGTIRS